MCQAFEAESNYIHAMEKRERSEGYDAQKRGEERESNPNFGLYSKAAWFLGWDTASEEMAKW